MFSTPPMLRNQLCVLSVNVLPSIDDGGDSRTERSIAFLDTLSVVNSDHTIRTREYRKDTHTDQYLNFNSNHPLEHKKGVVRTLNHRAESVVSDPVDMLEEVNHVKKALSFNDYPAWITSPNPCKPANNTKEATQSERRKVAPVVIPYIKGTSEQLRRVMKRYGVPVFFKPMNTLRQILVRPKDKLDKSRVVSPVYHIKCEQCSDSYVGETERSLRARFGEHRRPSSVTSEVSKHLHVDQPGHTVDIDNVRILGVEPRWFGRGVKEAIYIRTLHPSLNKDGGRFHLPAVWNNVLSRSMERGTHTQLILEGRPSS
ncbi:uncharacterized protein LOC141914249 [Tubulanus polymorphus]|uniref:uncharacterized protein LOC141914249 n=1 Tax=Tubulanus polymorphus TaxID=672921 RepID=UPI003DA24967